MSVTVGTCSICGGRVTIITPWWGINFPPAICEQCGATKADHGPVIDMKPVPKYGDVAWSYYKNTKTDEEKR